MLSSVVAGGIHAVYVSFIPVTRQRTPTQAHSAGVSTVRYTLFVTAGTRKLARKCFLKIVDSVSYPESNNSSSSEEGCLTKGRFGTGRA